MTATLKLTRSPLGVEVRRRPYEVLLDGKPVGSIALHDTVEFEVEPGHHALQIRDGRNSSRTESFDAAEDRVVAFRCSGKRFLPLFLLSFVVPSLALALTRE